MNRLTNITLTALLLAPLAGLTAADGSADGLVVYPPVPGLAASAHYQVRVRTASDGSQWQSAFAWETVCKTIEKKTDAYFDTLAGWTHIYARAKWHHWSGGRVFNMRGEGGRAAGAGVVFRNINIEDPRPTLQQFFICMTMPEPYSKKAQTRAAGDLSGVLFQNISIAAPSVLGEPQILWGQAGARIRDLTFENLTMAGKPVLKAEFFKTNEFVDGLVFVPGAGAKP